MGKIIEQKKVVAKQVIHNHDHLRIPFDFSSDGKRYYTFGESLKKDLGFKAHKVTIDAGFTCPNRDGAKSVGGCIYCNNKGFNPNSLQPRKNVREQVREGMAALRKRYKVDRFIAYFQAFTNTYASVDQLKEMYDEVFQFPQIVGLSIGTRPDCLSDEVIELIASYNDKTYLWVEVGLQSACDKTLLKINRGHDCACYREAVKRLHEQQIRVCTHVIIGLPGETRQEILHTAHTVADVRTDGLKIHPLHVIKNTALEKMHAENQLKLLSLEEYCSLVADFLEHIPPDVAIQRITAEGPPDYHIAPSWCLDKWSVLNRIDRELDKRNTYQGRLWLLAHRS